MQPRVIREIEAARQWVRSVQAQGERVGLVPTMGALHAGHMSLVLAAKRECTRVVTTIFVNPTQFGPDEDLDRYPRTWEADLDLLGREEVDVVFAPSATEMYTGGSNATCVQPSSVARPLEGAHRPTHFGGVATVVLKLFQILPADVAYFGEKDFQQCRVIADMVDQLNVDIELQFIPIMRDHDGVALSSRNAYLTDQERVRAQSLSRALTRATEAVAAGERKADVLIASVEQELHDAGITEIDYVAIGADTTLQPVTQLTGSDVLLIAAHVGKTRLIDNARLSF